MFCRLWRYSSATPRFSKDPWFPLFSLLARWPDLAAASEQSSLVHCITNLVVINLNAGVLLAVGASPVMARLK
ncbi:MAG: hydroxyethylthiazole kinase [Polaromonas sp.]|nr:hydroxyethylthiazole kinase [Polaromonas sp.]